MPMQFFQPVSIQATGVGAGQSNPAPCVTLESRRKCRNGLSDGANVSAMNEPQTASQPLIENMLASFRKAWDFRPAERIVKIAFMKAESVDYQPTQNRMKLAYCQLDPPT